MPYLTPDEIPEGTRCRPLFIPDSPTWLAIVSGAITELSKVYNWEQAGSVTPEDAAYRMLLMFEQYIAETCDSEMDVRQNSTEPCTLEKTFDGETWEPFADLTLCPPLIRIGDNGIIQTSNDGGTTWQDATVITPPPPPPTGGYGTHCLSARNAVEVYRVCWLEIYDQWSGGADILVGIAAVISIIATAIFIPIAVPLVWAFFQALWDVLSFLTGGEWTDEVTETLTCIFYCNSELNPDGSLQISSSTAIADEITAQGSANTIWGVIFYLWNIVGVTGTEQAASTRSIQAYDCVDCGCPQECGEADFTLNRGDYAQHDFTADSTCLVSQVFTNGQWIDGTGWTTSDAGGSTRKLAIHTFCDGVPDTNFYIHYSSTVNSILTIEVNRVSDGAQIGCMYHANTDASQGWNNIPMTGYDPDDDIEILIGVITAGTTDGVVVDAVQWTAP